MVDMRPPEKFSHQLLFVSRQVAPINIEPFAQSFYLGF